MSTYRKFFDEAPVGLYVTRATDGMFLQINSFGAKLLGYDQPEDLIDKVKSTDFYDDSIRQELIQELKEKKSITDFEILFHTKDGRDVWVSATAKNGSDRIYGSFTDISERKALEFELENMKQHSMNTLAEIAHSAKAKADKISLACDLNNTDSISSLGEIAKKAIEKLEIKNKSA